VERLPKIRPDQEAGCQGLVSEQANVGIRREALHREIMAAVRGAWASSKLWADGYVPGLGEFLRLERWREDPEPVKTGGVFPVEYKPRLYVPPNGAGPAEDPA